MVRAELRGDPASSFELVRLRRLGKRDGERLHLRRVPGHQPYDERRVKAAAEHRTGRSPRLEPHADGLVQFRECCFLELLLRATGRRPRRWVFPVRLHRRGSPLDDQHLPEMQLSDAADRGLWARGEAERQVRLDRVEVQLRTDQA
jgi:hypothetical protein